MQLWRGALPGRLTGATKPLSARICFAPAAVQQRQRRGLVVASASASASTVKIIIQGRKLPVTPAIKEYVEEKISRAVTHFQQEVKKIDVTLSARGGDTGTHGRKEQKVDVTIYTVRNGVVRVEDAEDSLYSSIDLVCDKLERKLRKVKEKAIARGRWPGRAGPHGPPHVDLQDAEFKEYLDEVVYETSVFSEQEAREKQFAALNAEFPKEVVRSKVVDVEPMNVEEALEALEAVGHDFFLFQDKKSGAVQVVYRRTSGGYGLLVPRNAVSA